MASRNHEKRKRAKIQAMRKEKQEVALLRRKALDYEGVTEGSAARMSRQALEHLICHGKLKPVLRRSSSDLFAGVVLGTGGLRR